MKTAPTYTSYDLTFGRNNLVINVPNGTIVCCYKRLYDDPKIKPEKPSKAKQ